MSTGSCHGLYDERVVDRSEWFAGVTDREKPNTQGRTDWRDSRLSSVARGAGGSLTWDGLSESGGFRLRSRRPIPVLVTLASWGLVASPASGQSVAPEASSPSSTGARPGRLPRFRLRGGSSRAIRWCVEPGRRTRQCPPSRQERDGRAVSPVGCSPASRDRGRAQPQDRESSLATPPPPPRLPVDTTLIPGPGGRADRPGQCAEDWPAHATWISPSPGSASSRPRPT